MSVSCADSNTCTTVGDYPTGLIFRTTDGGTTWTEQSATGGARALWGVSCADASTCTAVGTSLIHTTDGGATWTQSSGVAFGVSCPNVNTCIAVQGIGTIPRGDILRSTDGGVTWTQQLGNLSSQLYGVSCTDDNNTCTVVGQFGAILHTNTGGEPTAPQ